MTAALAVWFTAAAARDLSNFRPVSNDEGELMEVSYTLATQARLASPMYAGFFGAEQHHLWTLPVQHVLDAAAFKLFGAGLAQARWVSVAAAVATLCCVGWFALRGYGLSAALVAEILIVFWRSNLTSGATGLPLLDVARVARYDVLALAFSWLTLLALARPSRRATLAAGVLASLAGLSQFFGLAVLPVALVVAKRRVWTAAAALVAAPWVAFVALNIGDLAGQLSVYGQRGEFLRATFYSENLLSEPARYTGVLEQPGGWLLLGVGPALAWLVWQRAGSRGWLLVLTLASSAVLLTVLDHTKTPLYAILLVPTVCLLLAAGWSALPRRPAWYIATSVLLGAIVFDGFGAYVMDRAESAQVTPYDDVGQRIRGAVRPDGVVLGSERFWWALHDRTYISLRSLWFQWASANGAVRFADLAARWQPRSLVVNNNVRDDIQAFPPALQTEFWSFVAQCAELVDDIDDPTYFDIQIYGLSGNVC